MRMSETGPKEDCHCAMNSRVIPLLLSGLLTLLSAPACADELRVAAASNFRAAADELAKRFEVLGGHDVVLVFGSTGKHFAQIVNGAPYDVFLAADSERPRRLEEAGVGIPGTRFTYATGRLALWSIDPELVEAGGEVLQTGRFRHFAIANPALAPYGRAAKQTLQTLGVWQAIEPKLVMGENVAQAFQFVGSGNAQLGLVAWPQVLQFDRGSWWRIPASAHEPIEQQALQLTDASAATAFIDFLQSELAMDVIRSHGYGVADDR
jgi:molybdate transport system substrate-binding protein